MAHHHMYQLTPATRIEESQLHGPWEHIPIECSHAHTAGQHCPLAPDTAMSSI